MAELLTSLPGDIPGLLRRGSPACWTTEDRPRRSLRGVYYGQRDDGVFEVAGERGRRCLEADALDAPPALDLTDPTGRAHAAWWAVARLGDPGIDPTAWYDARRICDLAEMNRAMTAEQIDLLSHLVLRLAGRTP